VGSYTCALRAVSVVAEFFVYFCDTPIRMSHLKKLPRVILRIPVLSVPVRRPGCWDMHALRSYDHRLHTDLDIDAFHVILVDCVVL